MSVALGRQGLVWILCGYLQMFTTLLRKEALLEHVGLVEMTFLAVLSYAEWRHVFDHGDIMCS